MHVTKLGESRKFKEISLKAANVWGSDPPSEPPTTIENSGYSLVFEQICEKFS